MIIYRQKSVPSKLWTITRPFVAPGTDLTKGRYVRSEVGIYFMDDELNGVLFDNSRRWTYPLQIDYIDDRSEGYGDTWNEFDACCMAISWEDGRYKRSFCPTIEDNSFTVMPFGE